MRGAVAKKIRQLYNREYRHRVLEEQGFLARALKPKPRRMPAFLWRWLAGFFFSELPMRAHKRFSA